MEPQPSFQPLPHAEQYEYLVAAMDQIRQIADSPNFDHLDAGIVRSVVNSNPDFDSGTELFNILGTVFKDDEAPSEKLALAGLDVASYILRDAPTPRKLLARYFNACLEIDKIKTGMLGLEASTLTEHVVLDYMRKPLVEKIQSNPQTAKIIEMFGMAFARFDDQDPGHHSVYQWLIAKHHTLNVNHLRYTDFRSNIERYFPVDQVESGMPKSESAELSRTLTHEAMQRRNYGLKPAYTRASIGGSWIFYDGAEHERMLSEHSLNHRQKKYAAIIFHSPKDHFGDLEAGAEHIMNSGTAMISSLSGAIKHAEPDLALYITHDGVISYDEEGMTPLSNVLQDHPHALAAIEAEISANFFDLSMPIYRQGRGKLPPNFNTLSEKRTSFDPILDLVVPRIKYLKDLDQQSIPVEEEPVRTIREHGVVWHIRILPEGWSASPQALANAERNGVHLAENETFVRSHKRGRDNPVLGHKIVKNTVSIQ